MVNALRVRRGEGAGPQADYAARTRLKRGVLSSSSMRACLRLTVVAGIVAAGLSGACREAVAPGSEKDATSSTIASPRPLSVGDIAPEFSLLGSDGKQYSLASYRGRQAVVLVWFAKAFTEG
jgi:cytochrome oxidase Cu insertion factor (SCO1/SenC/PrrC family)